MYFKFYKLYNKEKGWRFQRNLTMMQLLPAVSFQNEVLSWWWFITQRDYLGIQEIQNLIAGEPDLSGPISLCKPRGTIWPLKSGAVESDAMGSNPCYYQVIVWRQGSLFSSPGYFFCPRMVFFSLSLVHSDSS